MIKITEEGIRKLYRTRMRDFLHTVKLDYGFIEVFKSSVVFHTYNEVSWEFDWEELFIWAKEEGERD